MLYYYYYYISKNLFAFQHFGYHVSVEHDEKHPQPKFGGNRFMGPKIWPDRYLISPTEISANLPDSTQLWTRPIYPHGRASGHLEPIHVKFGVWGFFIMLYWNRVIKMLKCKKETLMMSHFSTLLCFRVLHWFPPPWSFTSELRLSKNTGTGWSKLPKYWVVSFTDTSKHSIYLQTQSLCSLLGTAEEVIISSHLCC